MTCSWFGGFKEGVGGGDSVMMCSVMCVLSLSGCLQCHAQGPCEGGRGWRRMGVGGGGGARL